MHYSNSNYDLHIASPNCTTWLGEELSFLKYKSSSIIVPGVILSVGNSTLRPVFAHSFFPKARCITGKNLTECLQALIVAAESEPFEAAVIEVFPPELARIGSERLKHHPLQPLAQEAAEILQAKWKGRVTKRPPLMRTAQRLAVLMIDRTTFWWSWLPPSQSPLTDWPSTPAHGAIIDESQTNAPSSAHRKLDEAWALLGTKPNTQDVVFDAGAAPGGWTWRALQEGAQVVAVDRADLAPQVLSHPRCTYLRNNAFQTEVPSSCTWILCDIIGDPSVTFSWFQSLWNQHPRLSNAVITLKLKPPFPWELLHQAQQWVTQQKNSQGVLRHLIANKCEVTLLIKKISSL